MRVALSVTFIPGVIILNSDKSPRWIKQDGLFTQVPYHEQCVSNTVLKDENSPSWLPRPDSTRLRSPWVPDNAVTFLSENRQCHSNTISWHAIATPHPRLWSGHLWYRRLIVPFIFRNVGHIPWNTLQSWLLRLLNSFGKRPITTTTLTCQNKLSQTRHVCDSASFGMYIDIAHNGYKRIDREQRWCPCLYQLKRCWLERDLLFQWNWRWNVKRVDRRSRVDDD